MSALLAFLQSRVGLGVLGLIAAALVFVAMKIQVATLAGQLDKQVARNGELTAQVSALQAANRAFADTVAEQNERVRLLQAEARAWQARAADAVRPIIARGHERERIIVDSEITPGAMNQWMHELFP